MAIPPSTGAGSAELAKRSTTKVRRRRRASAAEGGPALHVPSHHGTIWYMGAKTRLLDALEAQIGPLLEAAAAARGQPAALVDLFSGTGAVSAHFAPYARILAADVQRYAAVLAEAALAPPPVVPGEAAARILAGAAGARDALAALLRDEVREEANFLAGPEATADLARYRAFVDAAAPEDPEAEAARLRAAGAPAALLTGYYRHVYFGVRQAIDLDALRFAIERAGAALAPVERARALAALLFTASRATSATAHFAQPRALKRDSEVRTLLHRRRIDTWALFEERLARLEREAKAPLAPPRVVAAAYPEAFAAFADEAIDVVYADPPYTADNYSRFYHVLETLVTYGYPKLARRGGALCKGRYPLGEDRFISGFTSARTVEGAFDDVTRLAQARGAALVWSYADSGLLFREVYGGRLERWQALLEERYRSVEVHRHALAHSGAGDKNRAVTELIAVCRDPR